MKNKEYPQLKLGRKPRICRITRIAIWLLILYPCIITGDTSFNKKLNSILAKSELKNASIGIEILDAEQDKILYSKNSEKCFLPASTMKIFTSFAALKFLGPEYRFKTEIYFNSENLCIKGYGNPELKTTDLLEIADKLIDLGIVNINNLIYDNSFFDEQGIGNGWVYEHEASAFNARISALSLNENCVEISIRGKNRKLYPETKFVDVIDSTDTKNLFTVRRKLIKDKNCIIIKGNPKRKRWCFKKNIDYPSLYTATVFKEILESKGIKVQGAIIKGSPDASYIRVYIHFSSPLVHLIYYMNKESSNFYAEQILKAIGAEITGPPGSSEKGIAGIDELLRDIGIPKEECCIYDGSGLSRYNLVSPGAIIKVLSSALSQWRIREEFMTTLPLAGVDGTLKNRFRKTEYIGKVRAKTGTMLSVSSICGYANTLGDNLIIFSIIINNHTLSTHSIKEIENEILKVIITCL